MALGWGPKREPALHLLATERWFAAATSFTDLVPVLQMSADVCRCRVLRIDCRVPLFGRQKRPLELVGLLVGSRSGGNTIDLLLVWPVRILPALNQRGRRSSTVESAIPAIVSRSGSAHVRDCPVVEAVSRFREVAN